VITSEEAMQVRYIERVEAQVTDEREDLARLSLEELMQRHEAPLYRFLVVLSANRDIALDCVQETFTRAYVQLRRGKPVNTQWLYKVARNRAIDDLRRRRREGADATVLDGLAVATTVEDMTSLLDAFAALSPEDRAILALAGTDDLTGEEIAERLGIRHGAVRMRLQRARTRFRRLYEGEQR
jgi:RNA polymerase sigma-70 factor (ECF subfamily)